MVFGFGNSRRTFHGWRTGIFCCCDVSLERSLHHAKFHTQLKCWFLFLMSIFLLFLPFVFPCCVCFRLFLLLLLTSFHSLARYLFRFFVSINTCSGCNNLSINIYTFSPHLFHWNSLTNTAGLEIQPQGLELVKVNTASFIKEIWCVGKRKSVTLDAWLVESTCQVTGTGRTQLWLQCQSQRSSRSDKWSSSGWQSVERCCPIHLFYFHDKGTGVDYLAVGVPACYLHGTRFS